MCDGDDASPRELSEAVRVLKEGGGIIRTLECEETRRSRSSGAGGRRQGRQQSSGDRSQWQRLHTARTRAAQSSRSSSALKGAPSQTQAFSAMAWQIECRFASTPDSFSQKTKAAAGSEGARGRKEGVGAPAQGIGGGKEMTRRENQSSRRSS